MMNARDYVMARLAVAQTQIDGMRELVTDALVGFLDPDEDGDGSQRLESIDAALMGCHSTATALGNARRVLTEMSDEDLGECEPDEDEVREDEETEQ